MPKTGENKKPIQFPRKFHRSTDTFHFSENALFVDEIHRGDQHELHASTDAVAQKLELQLWARYYS